MNGKRAFGYVDSLLALLVVMFATTAVVKMQIQCKRSISRFTEQQKAMEILAHVKQLPAAYLEIFGKRFYDELGRPAGEGAKFQVLVEKKPGYGMVTFWCELTYRDVDGKPRAHWFYKTKWRPHEGNELN